MAGISDYNRAIPSSGRVSAGYAIYDGDSGFQRSSEGVFGYAGRSSSRNENLEGYGPHGPGYSSPRLPYGPVTSAPDQIDFSDPNIQNYTAKGIGIAGLVAENLLSHPFIVFRRQCQVHVQSWRYHLFPFTLVSPMVHICQRQGMAVLWKGLGSTLVVRGMTLAVEDVMSKVTPLPKEISRHSTLKAFMQHILLKSLSIAAITPFYSASLVETVQSEVASETAGFFDVFREGFWRLLAWPSTGRLVPLHVLIIPTVAHGILSYLIYTGIKSVSLSTIRRVRESKERKQGALSKDTSLSYHTETTASLIGHMVADILLFPLETIIHRLHLQGTRTIIDSLDTGFEVTPILTSYGGVLDCLRTTIDEEGFSGLYKGFGALILQYGVQMLLIRAVKVVLENTPLGGGSNSGSQEKYSPYVIGGIGSGTPISVHQSRSEPSNINRSFDALNRHTPPMKELQR
ncbi:unnamed protein product [Orchesella dallaii]|uniref:Solute carrier family 25 member 46 n=1 Tax=Orchesella dallaii TaxID=48710 RepID=A0ABP1RFN7_9HEXA